jgi:predicted CXXCH cytochrome family protein
VFEKNGWPECATCHGNHAIIETDDSMLSEESSPLCYEWHREFAEDNPLCVRTSRYFHASITDLTEELDALGGQVHGLAEKGLDVDPLEATVDALEDYLRQLRSLIHTFEWSEFDEVERPARAEAKKGRQLVVEAEAEHRLRRNWLSVSLAVMLLLALVIYLKIVLMESDS